MVITMESIIKALKCYEGTSREMQLRVMLHEMKAAADDGKMSVCIDCYKLSKLHMPTLRFEILKLSGFESEEFESSEIPGHKMLRISWN